MRAPKTDFSKMTTEEISAHKKVVNKRKSDKYYALRKEEIAVRRKGNRKEEGIKYRAKRGEELKESQRIWNLENKERAYKNKHSYYLKNKDTFIKKAKEWAIANPEKTAVHRNVQCAKRRATIAGSTPLWANKFYIREAYDLAKRRSLSTGIKWHVDHIVPIRSKLVCGLHVEHNLQVIPAKINHRKSNKFWLDMPEGE